MPSDSTSKTTTASSVRVRPPSRGPQRTNTSGYIEAPIARLSSFRFEPCAEHGLPRSRVRRGPDYRGPIDLGLLRRALDGTVIDGPTLNWLGGKEIVRECAAAAAAG